MGDLPIIGKVVEHRSGWLDGPENPWRTSYLVETFGSLAEYYDLEWHESRGNVLKPIGIPKECKPT